MEEALAHPAFAGEPCPPLATDTEADVVIVGGGYTGMWTAFFLTEREPGLDVVLLEQDICGGGPSGRNGGFVNGFSDELGLLLELYGEEGRRTAELADRSIDDVGTWCAEHEVDAWYSAAGDLGVSTSSAQDAVVRSSLEEAAANGFAERYLAQTPDQVRARCDSPVFRGGVLSTHAAHVQPARLARGLRRVLLERGVRIFEDTPVARFRAGSPVAAETRSGTVRAGRAVVGVNAWAHGWRAFRRDVAVRGTYIVMSAPAPEALERIGWTGGEGLYDFRTALHYVRSTPDGRIAFGGAGLRVARQGIGPRYRFDEGSVASLVADFRRWFPSFADVPLEAAWGGPIDMSGYRLPFFGSFGGGTVLFGLGFTGNGVGPSHLGGRILSGLALDVQDEYTSVPLVGATPKRFPPPWLFRPGERVVSAAILRKDRLEDDGRRVDPLTSAIARLPRRLGYNLGP